MALIPRNDEQIQVGTTTGLVAGSSSFVFDGSGSPAKPDYRQYILVVSEIGGLRVPMIVGKDYSWNYTTGTFTLLQSGDVLKLNQYYNIHFEPVTATAASLTALIDSTFFIRDINLTNTLLPATIERINLFIAKYQPQCLQLILGYPLYKVLLNESSQRVTDLINGVEYTDVCGNLRKWQGLVHDTNISLIADYVYYYFQETAATQTTGISTGAMKIESGVSVSPQIKMIDAWNFFSKEVKDMIFFLWTMNSLTTPTPPYTYPEFTDRQFCITKELTRPINEFGI